MRIVAGKFRHRNIKMTNLESTRETQDSVREAMFNSIGPYFDGGIALDLFCGSGALAIEAYSRGISKIYLNDIEPKALKIAKENVSLLGITDACFSNMEYSTAIKSYEKAGLIFDYIFLDPPYKLNDIEQILNELIKISNENTLFIFEMSKDSNSDVPNFTKIKEKNYGIKKIAYYRYK